MGRHKSLLMWRARKRQRCKEGEKTSVVLNNGLYPTHPSNSLSHVILSQLASEKHGPRALPPGPNHFSSSPGPTKTPSLIRVLSGFYQALWKCSRMCSGLCLEKGNFFLSAPLWCHQLVPPTVYQARVHAASMRTHLALSSGVDMLQRRLLSILLRVVRERPVWADRSTVTGSLLCSCVKHNQASVEWRCNKCLNGRDGSGSPTLPWLIVPDVLTQRSKNSTLRMKFCSLPESGPLLVTFP